jgi:hypothetical protein
LPSPRLEPPENGPSPRQRPENGSDSNDPPFRLSGQQFDRLALSSKTYRWRDKGFESSVPVVGQQFVDITAPTAPTFFGAVAEHRDGDFFNHILRV